MTQRTFVLFFEVIRLLLSASVSVVAEAAFTHSVWEAQLRAVHDLADLRVVRCRTDPATRVDRLAQRGTRRAHADRPPPVEGLAWDGVASEWRYLSIDVPTLDVDTTYELCPTLSEVIAFVNSS